MTATTEVELTPTATYAARSAEWVPVSDTDGVLVIRLRRTAHGKEENSVYAVKTGRSGDGAREFELTRTTGNRVAYVCVIDGENPICTCRAGECKTDCKHLASIKALIATGAL